MNIRLPEHNSSRLIFVPSSITGNNPDFKLYIEDTTTDSNCSCSNSDSEYPSNWLLGKLNSYCWYLEDCGIYDSNHYHTANIYYYDSNNIKQNYITVTRSMEYGEESDRLYCEHSGSLKVLLYDYSQQNIFCNFYIKYERNLPAAKESIANLTDTTTGETLYNCVCFFKYNNENQLIMTEAIQLNFSLSVKNEDDTPMSGINYCNIVPTKATCDTNKLSLIGELNENTLQDIMVGLVGTTSLGEKNDTYHYYGKFMPVDYYENNYQPIDPSYFIVQAPKNGWIALRIGIGSGTLLYNERYKNNKKCGFIRQSGAGLNGYFGNYKPSSDTYQYDIDLNRDNEPCMFMIPELFCNYSQIIWKNSSGASVSYSGLPQEELYNELDGMFYRIFILPPSSPIQKITLHYSKI